MEILQLQIDTIKAMLDWRVTLDIFLIGLGFFLLYQFLRSTGTWKTVSGIFVFIFIYIIARLLELKGIMWIYSYFSPIIVIAIIILFQPEIRRIFERLSSFRGRGGAQEGSHLISIICDALFKLKAKKHGAIVVLPGLDAIRPWVSEGIHLDAVPSFPLLMSIFDPHSPGHDGALVIENGRFAHFAVRLPLSKTDVLSEDFGTRHHACLGLSEVTDALVLVVSEEMGTVTLFKSGQAEAVQDKHALIAAIGQHGQRKPLKSPSDLRKNTRGRIGFQLAVCFVLAFIFWSLMVLTQGN